MGPVDFSSTLQVLEDALTLVQQARREAGHDQEGTYLSTKEFKKALDFLQRIFEGNFKGMYLSTEEFKKALDFHQRIFRRKYFW